MVLLAGSETAKEAEIARLVDFGLDLNQAKTTIVYCKDDDRPGSYEHESFTFLGCTFRPTAGQ